MSRRLQKGENAYRKYISEKEEQIQDARAEELRVRRLIYESLEDSIHEVEVFGKRLFEKTADDKDFLQVYLGSGWLHLQIRSSIQSRNLWMRKILFRCFQNRFRSNIE